MFKMIATCYASLFAGAIPKRPTLRRPCRIIYVGGDRIVLPGWASPYTVNALEA